MPKSKPATAAEGNVMPDLPNASIDMNKLLENDAAGKSGSDMLTDALLVEPSSFGEPAPEPVAEKPAAEEQSVLEDTSADTEA